MLDDLDGVVLPAHRPAVQRRLEALDAATRAAFAPGDEQTFALRPDAQGIGGPSRAPAGADVVARSPVP